MSTEQKTKYVYYGVSRFGVAIGVAYAAGLKLGSWEGFLHGAFWEVWVGYRLANYLLG